MCREHLVSPDAYFELMVVASVDDLVVSVDAVVSVGIDVVIVVGIVEEVP